MNLEACTAPPGKIRLVYVDPRDFERTHERDCTDLDEVERFLTTIPFAQAASMEAYDHSGARVSLQNLF